MQNSQIVQQDTSERNTLSKVLVMSFKILFSGFLALIILTAGAFFYCNLPEHVSYSAEKNLDNPTDYSYSPHGFYSIGIEGFGTGRVNNEGYNNLFDYSDDTKVEALLMGSSHMQAFEVMQKNTLPVVLNNLSKKLVYNIGVANHAFPVCVQNLKAAIKKYQPSKYLILETYLVSFGDKDLEKILNSQLPNVSGHTGKLILFFRRNPYFYLLFRQFTGTFERLGIRGARDIETETPDISNPELLSKVLQHIKQTVDTSGAKTIIFYHPNISLNDDGTLEIISNPEAVKQFSDLCKQNGIYFLDMSERFLREYKENHILPYGFFNTSVGKGHSNNNGHKIMAEELFKLMQKIESEETGA